MTPPPASPALDFGSEYDIVKHSDYTIDYFLPARSVSPTPLGPVE